MSDTPADNTNPDTAAADAAAAAAAAAAADAAKAEAKKKTTKSKDGKEWIVAVHGRMLHLHTNVWFDADPKRHELDDFVKAQLEAGKLAIYTE